MKISLQSKRLSAILRKPLNLFLQEEFTPNQIGIVTIIAIEIDGELSVADIFVNNLLNKPNYINILQKKTKFCSQFLLKTGLIKNQLKIRFREDNGGEYAQNIESIFKKTS